jgi:hypothetical protein
MIPSILTLQLPHDLAFAPHSAASTTILQIYTNLKLPPRILQQHHINLLILPHQHHINIREMSSIPPPTDPVASFLDLPPEIRQSIYDLLLIDPIRDNNRLVCTSDRLDRLSWSRMTGLLPIRQIERSGRVVSPSVSHIDYSDLWSLASTNKLLFVEASPTMCMHAQLEYTFGDFPHTRREPTLLHKYLGKISPTTSSLYRNLTIINGCLLVKETRTFVDVINLRLPNLLSLSIESVSPESEGWPEPDFEDLLRDALEIATAARPVAHLTSRPVLSIKPRLSFYLKHEPFRHHRDYQFFKDFRWPMSLGSTKPLTEIKDWRRQAQNYHTNACQRGDYLLLTRSLRSTLNAAVETHSVEEINDTEDKLANHQKISSQIMKCKAFRSEHARLLYYLRD